MSLQGPRNISINSLCRPILGFERNTQHTHVSRDWCYKLKAYHRSWLTPGPGIHWWASALHLNTLLLNYHNTRKEVLFLYQFDIISSNYRGPDSVWFMLVHVGECSTNHKHQKNDHSSVLCPDHESSSCFCLYYDVFFLTCAICIDTLLCVSRMLTIWFSFL